MLKLPSGRPLSGTEGPNVPHFFVGDEGSALNRNILRPFGESNLSVKKRVYNYRLCRAGGFVDCALGILSNKWTTFQRQLNVSPDLQSSLLRPVLFCIILFAREMVIILKTLSQLLILKMYLMDNQYMGVNSEQCKE
jgi:hypothetical protein